MILIKSKARTLHLRDGRGPGDPVKVVGPLQWVEFDNMPRASRPPGNLDLEIKIVAVEASEEPPPVEPAQEDQQDAESKPVHRKRGRRR